MINAIKSVETGPKVVLHTRQRVVGDGQVMALA
jgi:hypothetical protein